MLATVVIACAYALLLLSAISFRGTANWQTGIVWGLAGYTVFLSRLPWVYRLKFQAYKQRRWKVVRFGG